MTIRSGLSLAALGAVLLLPAFSPCEAKEPRRTRIGLGVQFVPAYPGADDLRALPLFDLARTRGDKEFAFEAPDDAFGFSVIRNGPLRLGPSLNVRGSRTADDVGAALDKVDTTVEAGAYVQYMFGSKFRVRADARRGLGGHDGWIGALGADYVARDKDRWLFSIGPRLTVSDGQFHRAYFGVTPAESVRTGLATFRPSGGVQAVGATAGLITQVSRRVGLYTYAKYDRLVDDAARSPVVRTYGSRDQFAGGVALTYTFGRGVKK
jgi:outer membrane scaffolding protein for murein synthesis (MipA/OmpV family)